MISQDDMTAQEEMYQAQPIAPKGYEPTGEQRARLAAARRFRRLYIYLPLAMSTAVFAVLSLYLFYLALFPPHEGTHLFLSGLADFILALCLLPVVLIFGLVTTAGAGGYIYYWYILDEARRPIGPGPAHGRIRTLLWRVEFLFTRLLPEAHKVAARIARPVIRLNGWLAAAEAWLNNLRKIINFGGK